jgi:hypothetical protein
MGLDKQFHAAIESRATQWFSPQWTIGLTNFIDSHHARGEIKFAAAPWMRRPSLQCSWN